MLVDASICPLRSTRWPLVGNSVFLASLLALGLTMFDLLAHSVVRSSLSEARVMLSETKT